MTDPAHGTRARYQRGCLCLPCRAAEAQYRSRLRLIHRSGKIPLYALVSAVGAARRVRQLQIEGVTKAQIARALGLRTPLLQLTLTADAKITARNAVRIKRLHYRWMVEGSDGPDHANV